MRLPGIPDRRGCVSKANLLQPIKESGKTGETFFVNAFFFLWGWGWVVCVNFPEAIMWFTLRQVLGGSKLPAEKRGAVEGGWRKMHYWKRTFSRTLMDAFFPPILPNEWVGNFPTTRALFEVGGEVSPRPLNRASLRREGTRWRCTSKDENEKMFFFLHFFLQQEKKREVLWPPHAKKCLLWARNRVVLRPGEPWPGLYQDGLMMFGFAFLRQRCCRRAMWRKGVAFSCFIHWLMEI